MAWTFSIPTRASQRLQDDIVDLARDSMALKRENAELRQQLLVAQRAAAHAEEELAISRQAHAVVTVQIALLERLAHALLRGAAEHTHWPLARWVKFGPMAALIEQFKKGTL